MKKTYIFQLHYYLTDNPLPGSAQAAGGVLSHNISANIRKSINYQLLSKWSHIQNNLVTLIVDLMGAKSLMELCCFWE